MTCSQGAFAIYNYYLAAPIRKECDEKPIFDLMLTLSALKMRRATKQILIYLALMSNLTETCLIREQLAHRAANREEGTCLDVYCSKFIIREESKMP